MAFPQTSAPAETSLATAAGSIDVNMPASVNTDACLLMKVGCSNGGAAPATPSGWTDLTPAAFNDAVAIFGKKADGTEGGTTVNVSFTGTHEAAAQVYHVTDWGGTLSTDVDIAGTSTASTSSPDPPSVSAGWGADDNLFIGGTFTYNDDITPSAYSANYSNGITTLAGGGTNNGAGVSTARRELNASSDNPGTLTLPELEICNAFTIVIKPGTAGAPAGNPYYAYAQQ